MLPIYKAIEVVEVISENAGHNKPWVIKANTPESLTSFVVKMYTTVQVEQSNLVQIEVVCNILAGEFDLVAPKCALIEIPMDLILRMNAEEQLQYDNADPRLKFGTVLIDNVKIAISGLKKPVFEKRISLDTLYAFDNLIRNRDRGVRPNLLLGPKEAILIDHELALGQRDINNIDLNALQLEDIFTKYHLFYPFLKRLRKDRKLETFNEFTEHLRRLRINKLNPYFRQLSA